MFFSGKWFLQKLSTIFCNWEYYMEVSLLQVFRIEFTPSSWPQKLGEGGGEEGRNK
jgi:hypothetical protein